MPTYTFRCTICSKEQEIFCKITERDSVTCKYCGEKLERTFNTNSIPEIGPGGRNLKSPEWFKDRINKINKDLGTNAEVYK